MRGPNGMGKVGGSDQLWRTNARLQAANVWLTGGMLVLYVLAALVVCGGVALLLI